MKGRFDLVFDHFLELCGALTIETIVGNKKIINLIEEIQKELVNLKSGPSKRGSK